MIEELSNCPKCKSCYIVDGVIGTGGSSDVHFIPGHIKWYKMLFSQPSIAIQPYARCCTACGLLWMNLVVSVLKKFISTNCNEEFISIIYDPEYLINSKQANCPNCGSKRKIPGHPFIDGMSEMFIPNYLIDRKIRTSGTALEEISNCCIYCVPL